MIDLHAPGALPGAAAVCLGARGLPQQQLARCLSGTRLLPALAALEVRQGGRLAAAGAIGAGSCVRRDRRAVEGKACVAGRTAAEGGAEQSRLGASEAKAGWRGGRARLTGDGFGGVAVGLKAGLEADFRVRGWD